MNYLLSRSPVYISVILFVILALGIYYLQPKYFFDNKGEIKEFGLEHGKTIFTYPVVLIILAIFIYLLTFIMVYLYNEVV